MVVGSQNVLLTHGYQIGPNGTPVPKPLRPTTIGDARQQIRQIFERQGWDDETQTRYFRLKHVEAKKVDDLTAEQVRLVLGFMESASMILYRD